MRTAGAAAVACVVATGCRLGGPPEPATEDAARAAYLEFKAAVDENAGQRALARASADSLAYFESLRFDALRASEEEVREMRLRDQGRVLELRLRLTAEELRGLDGAGLFTLAVDRDFGVDEPLLEPGEITLEEERAKIQLRIGETAMPRTAYRMVLEHRRWKADAASMAGFGEKMLAARVEKAGAIDDAAMLAELSARTGLPATAAVWQPLEAE